MMMKRYLLALVFFVVLINLYLTSASLRRNNFISELIDQVNLQATSAQGQLVPVNSPIVKNDRKDNDQYNIMLLYRDLNNDLICRLLILPDGIKEDGSQFRISLITFNVSATEDKFVEKNGDGVLPQGKKQNKHKLMKPCKGEVYIPILEDIGFILHNITSLQKTKDQLNYHKIGYCTKSNELSDRFIEIDGKSSEHDKFQFEFQLLIMGILYPEKYAAKNTILTITGWKYFLHMMIIVGAVLVLMTGHYWYNTRFRKQMFQKVNNDVELQTIDRVDHDLDQFIIEDEDEDDPAEPVVTPLADKKNKKVSFKDVDEEEVKNLLKNSE